MSSMLNQKNSNQKSNLVPRLILSERQLNVLINLLDKETIEGFLKLDELKAGTTNLNLAENLKKVIISKLKEVKTEYKVLTKKKVESKEKLQLISENKRILYMTLNYLNKVIRLDHNILNIRAKKKKLEDLKTFETEQLYSSEITLAKKWKHNILNNDEEIDIDEYLEAYKWFLKNENLNIYQKEAWDYGKRLQDKILDTDDQESIVNNLSSVLDTISQRMLRLGDDINNERESLRLIRRSWKDSLSIYKEKKIVVRDDRLYDIMQFWLSSSDFFSLIKNALKTKPAFVNCHKHDEHILVDIVRKYIDNYKIELRNQSSYYVSNDYYKKVYELYRSNFAFELRDSENVLIENLLKEFRDFVASSNYKAERKLKCFSSIDEMNSSGLKKKALSDIVEINIDEFKNSTLINSRPTYFDRKSLEETKSKINELQEMAKIRYGRELTNATIEVELGLNQDDIIRIESSSKVIMFKGESVAYNTHINEKGNYVLNIHTPDIASFKKSDLSLDRYLSDTVFDEYLYKLQKRGIKMNDKLQQHFSFEKGKSKPSITYQLEITPAGKIIDLNFKQGMVCVDEIYGGLKICHNEEMLLEMIRIYRILTKSREEYIKKDNITSCFSIAVNNMMQSIIDAYDLPFLEWGKNNTSEVDYTRNLFELCELLSRLKETDFYIVHNLIKQNNDELHYSDQLFINGIYENNFVDPSCYVDSYNQRIIKYISDGNDYKQAKEKFEQLSREKVQDLNKSIEYVGIEDFKVKCKRR